MAETLTGAPSVVDTDVVADVGSARAVVPEQLFFGDGVIRRPAEGARRFGGGGGGANKAAHFACVVASDRCRRRPVSGIVYRCGIVPRIGGVRPDADVGGVVGGGVGGGVGGTLPPSSWTSASSSSKRYSKELTFSMII